MVHLADIPEILDEIFGFCDVPTLAKAAAVSIVFHACAMGRLWRSSLSLVSLFRILRPTFGPLTSVTLLIAVPNYAYFRNQTAPVKRLYYSENKTSLTQNEYWIPGRVLWDGPDAFPNLTILHFELRGTILIPTLQGLLTPSLQRVHISLEDCSSLRPFGTRTLSLLARALMPNLRCLYMDYHSAPGSPLHQLETLSPICTILSNHPSLEHVTLGRALVDSAVLQCLSKSSSLKSLRFIGRLTSDVLSTLPSTNMSPGPFPALSELEVTATPIQCSHLIKAVSSQSMNTLRLCYHGNSASEIRECLAVASRRFLLLHTISITPYESSYAFLEKDEKLLLAHRSPSKAVRRIALSQISLGTLDPLLTCRLLRDVIIEWPHPLHLNRKAFEEMVDAWPDLESLYLNPSPFCVLGRPQATLTDLAPFNRSKNLVRLSVFVHAVPDDDMSGMDIQGTSSSRVYFLDLGRSWINQPDAVAKVLGEMFPYASLPPWIAPLSRWRTVRQLMDQQKRERWTPYTALGKATM